LNCLGYTNKFHHDNIPRMSDGYSTTPMRGPQGTGGWRFPQGESWGYVPRPRTRRSTIVRTATLRSRQVFTPRVRHIPHHIPANCRPHAASTAIALRMQGTVLIAYGLAHRSSVATRTMRPPHGGRGTAAKVPGLPA